MTKEELEKEVEVLSVENKRLREEIQRQSINRNSRLPSFEKLEGIKTNKIRRIYDKHYDNRWEFYSED